MKVFESKAELALATLSLGQIVRTKGDAVAGDLGGRTYIIYPGATGADGAVNIQNNMNASLLYYPIESVVSGNGIDVTLVDGVLTITKIAGIWGDDLWDITQGVASWNAGPILSCPDAQTQVRVATTDSGGIPNNANTDVIVEVRTSEGNNFNAMDVQLFTDLGNSSAVLQVDPTNGGVLIGAGPDRLYTLTFDMSAVNGNLDEIRLFQNFNIWQFDVMDVRYV